MLNPAGMDAQFERLRCAISRGILTTHRVINAAEAAEILGCSRQNIIDLTKRGKLHPIKTSEKSTLYLKSEVLKRNWQ